ncbi:MAG: flagellar basal body-associated FliL family protein [Mucispirillum sp.]|nr:flagellar basal body-associated FliL family protein [Mucispirillum sp.]
MAEDSENTEQQTRKKSSKLKFIIIGLVAILLLVVILVVVYMLVLAPKSDTTDQTAQQNPAVQAPAAVPLAPAVQQAAPPPAPAMGGGMDMGISNAEMGQIYPIPTLNVNLADPTGITYLAITLALEFDPKNSDLYSEVETKMPRITDMIITTLSSKAYEEISTSQGKVNLKNEFLRRINAMLAKGRLYNVYITGFTVQR